MNSLKCHEGNTLDSSTLIDYMLMNREDLYVQGGNISLSISDHQLIFTARKKDKSPRDFKYVQCRLYRTFDPKSFQHDIDQANWEEAPAGCKLMRHLHVTFYVSCRYACSI